MRKQIYKGLFLVLLGLGSLGLFALAPKNASAANPSTMNFQGKLVNADGTNVANSTYSFIFRIYNTASPTTTTACTSTASCLWEETQASVSVTNGVFQVELGAACALTSASCNNAAGGPINWSTTSSLYLTLQFNGDAAGFMSPTVHLTSVPFAFNADQLGGISSSGFIQNTTSQQATSNFNISGTGVAGTALQAPTFDSATANAALGIGSANAGVITLGNVTNSSFLFRTKNAAAALQVQDAGGSPVLSIDTNQKNVILGSSTEYDGTLVFNNADNTNTATIKSGITSTSYTLTLPTTGPSTSQCLQSDSATASQLVFAACAGGGGGDNISVNGAAAADANIIDTAATGSVTGATWTLSTAPSPDTIALSISNASATVAGAVTTGTQTFAGNKTFNGTVLVNPANSATAFQIQNSSATTLLKVDTASNNSNNLLTNPSVESAISGNWTAKNGSGTSTPTQVSSPVYNASNSLQVVTSGTATNAGVTQAITMSNSTVYVLSVYVNSLSGFVSTAGAGTFDMGFGSGGVDTSCLTAQKVPAAAWTRLTCSFNTGTLSTSPYIYFKQTDATGRTFYIDSAVLETDANATSKWQDGKITLNGTINSPLIIQPAVDSSNTLLVQNSNGINVFGVDTTDTNLVANPGVEINTTGWSYNGTATGTAAVSRDVSNSYLGYAGLRVINDTDVGDGAKFTFSPNTLLQASTSYVLSFYAKDSAGSYSTLTFGRSENGSQTNCVTTGAITTNWTRFSCSFTVGATIGASPYVYVAAGTASKTIYIDAVSLEPGSVTSAPYGSASIYLNGVITSPVNFQNKADSTLAFQIQNASSIGIVSIDTSNLRILIGSSTTDANAVILVLDSYNNGTDPTGVNGGMYYNTSTNKFRCYENGAWANCIGSGGGSSVTKIAGSSGAAGTDITLQKLTSNSSDVTTTTLSSSVMSTTGVGAGTWRFRYTIFYQTAATTTGIGFGINHTGAGTTMPAASWIQTTTGGAAATGVGDNVAGTVAGQLAEGKSGTTLNAIIGSASAGVAVINTNVMATLEGVIVVTNSGTLELKISSEVSSSAVRLMANSVLELTAF